MNAQPTAMIEPRKVDAGRGWSWFAEAFGLFRQETATWIGIALSYLLIQIVAALIPGASLLTSLFAPVFSGGMILGCHSQASGRGLKFEYLFAGFRGGNFGQLMLLSLLYMAGFIVVMLIGLAIALLGFGLSPANFSNSGVPDDYVLPLLLVLLIVFALIIPLMMGMWLAPALIVLRGLGPVAAFKLSFKACLINFVPFLLYGVIGLLIAIVATIPFLLGWLVAMPVFAISIYTTYRDLFPPAPDFAATQPIPVPPPL